MFKTIEDKKIFVLTIIEYLISLVAIAIFTLIFRLEESNIRYLFFIGDIYVIGSFTKSLSNFKIKSEKRIIKNSHSIVSAK